MESKVGDCFGAAKMSELTLFLRRAGRGTGRVCAAGLVLLFTVATGAASSADDSLAYRDRGNRFEGHRRVEVAAPAFEALSFVRGGLLRQRGTPAMLKVRFFLPQPSRVHLRARELVPVTFYQMTVKRMNWSSGWNTFGSWDTSEVIEPLQVPLANIAVIARVGDDRPGSGELAPVSFTRADASASKYEFVFKVKYDLKKTTYRVEGVGSGTVVASGSLGRLIGGTPVSLQFDLAGARAGRYRLLVDCLYRGRRGGPQRTFEFYHQR